VNADPKPYLIGVAGPSCAGKTELSRALAHRLNAALLPLDAYYFDLSDRPFEERARFNFDVPDALDHQLFLQQVTDLENGRAINVPVYDFATHARTTRTQCIEPQPFIVVEGLFVLYWDDVASLFGTKVFVDLGDEVCLKRRIKRDVVERGRTEDSVVKQCAETVMPMAKQYVRPTRQQADIVVAGDSRLDASVAVVLAHIETHAPTGTVPNT
jgi:uridine kinase